MYAIVGMSVRSRERSHVDDDDEDTDCRSVGSGMPCSSPILIVCDRVVDFPPDEVVPSGYRGLPSNRLYRPDDTTMTDVLCISEETDFYVDDCRFGERLASFRDDSDDEFKLVSRMPEHRRPALHHRASENPVEGRHLPTGSVNKSAAKAGGYINDGEKLMHTCDIANNRTSPPITTATAVICKPREQPMSTAYDEFPLCNTSSKSTVADCCMIANHHDESESVTTRPESIETSPLLYRIERRANDDDDVTFVKSESKANQDAVQDNWIGEQTKWKTVTHRPVDVFRESEKSRDSSADTTACKLPNHVEEMDVDDDNENYFSCDDNVETEEEMVKANSCSRQLCSFCTGMEKSNGDEYQYHIFDSSASIYDRVDKYYGVAHRRRQISSTKKLSQLLLRMPPYPVAKQSSNDNSAQRELSSASGRSSNSFDVSVRVDSSTVFLPSDSAKTPPDIRHPTETLWPMTNEGSCPQFERRDANQLNGVGVRSSNQKNRAADGAEKGVSTGVNPADYEQRDENAATTSATLQSIENNSSKDDVVVTNNSLIPAVASDNNSMPVLARAVVPEDADYMDVDGYFSSLPKIAGNKKNQLTAADASAATHDAKTRRQGRLPGDLTDLENVVFGSSYKENRQHSDDDDVRTQLTTKNVRAEVVSSDSRLGSSRLGDSGVQSQRTCSTSTAARSPSFVVVDIDINEGRRSRSLAVSDEHRRRLEALKQQLTNAKPVAPASSSSIDSVWNSRIAGKLTPAARSRSAVWTPYDAFFDDTTTRPSAVDHQMWRTTSLQTLPVGKLTAAGLCHRPSGSTIHLAGSENNDTGIGEDSQQADMLSQLSDKSRSLSDLRYVSNDGPRLRVHDMGSIDAGLNSEQKTASSAAVPLRPLSTEEFIRRSLERLNLPDWYLNSSSSPLRKKVVGTGRQSASGSAKSDATSCTAVDTGKPGKAGWQSVPVTHRPSASRVSAAVATSVADYKHSQLPVYHFATSDNLQPAIDQPHTSTRRKSIHRDASATDGVVLLSTEIQTHEGVGAAQFRNRERRQIKSATTAAADEKEKHRCPHGKKNLSKCSQCRQNILESGLSTTRCETTVNEHMTNTVPSESTTEATAALSSKVFEVPTADKMDDNRNIFSYSTAVEPTAKHRTRNRIETAVRRSTQNKKNMAAKNDQNEVIVTPNYNVMENRTLYCQEVTVDGTAVDEKGKNKLPTSSTTLEGRGTGSIPAVRPRPLRLRKVKSKTCSDDVEMCTDVSEQNISKQKPSNTSSNNPLFETVGSPSSNQTPATRDSTWVVPTTREALETSGNKNIHHDISAKFSDQNVAVEDCRRQGRRIQRRRRRQQPENICADASTVEGMKKDTLTDNSDHSVINSNYLLTRRSNECNFNHIENVELMQMPLDGEQGEAPTSAKVRHRLRTDDRLVVTESPSGECLQHREEFQDRGTLDMNDRTTFHRRRRRRIRNDPSSRLNVEPQRQGTDDPPIQTMTLNGEHKLRVRLHGRSQNELQSASVLPRSDTPHRRRDLERTVRLFFEDSLSTLTEGNPDTTSSSCRAGTAECTSSTSYRHQEYHPRRLLGSTAPGSNSVPVDLATEEVMNELEQDGAGIQWTSNRSESLSTEQKPCLSAAARRCRRVHKSQRSR